MTARTSHDTEVYLAMYLRLRPTFRMVWVEGSLLIWSRRPERKRLNGDWAGAICSFQEHCMGDAGGDWRG